MGDTRLSLIPHEHVADLWPLAEPHIARAVAHADGLVTIDDHRDGVLRGTKQLWLITNDDGSVCYGAGVTEIIHDICFIWGLGGKQMKRWWDTQDMLELWATAQSCRRIEFFGRKGWGRALRSRGYKERFVVLSKELR